MPTYEYLCRKCGHRFELFHSMKDETRKRCPKCRGAAGRVPAGGAGLIFKGSGFYITDYRSKAYKEHARRESPAGGEKPASRPETPGAGAKPATRPDAPGGGGKKAPSSD